MRHWDKREYILLGHLYVGFSSPRVVSSWYFLMWSLNWLFTHNCWLVHEVLNQHNFADRYSAVHIKSIALLLNLCWSPNNLTLWFHLHICLPAWDDFSFSICLFSSFDFVFSTACVWYLFISLIWQLALVVLFSSNLCVEIPSRLDLQQKLQRLQLYTPTHMPTYTRIYLKMGEWCAWISS